MMISDSWNGLLAPAGTPPAIIKKLHEAVAAALKAPDLKEKLEAQGGVVIGNNPEEFRADIRQEVKQWSEQFKNVKIDTQ
jgi:tripartite-type tricarboxylate transporter receptor subunit TctC